MDSAGGIGDARLPGLHPRGVVSSYCPPYLDVRFGGEGSEWPRDDCYSQRIQIWKRRSTFLRKC